MKKRFQQLISLILGISLGCLLFAQTVVSPENADYSFTWDGMDTGMESLAGRGAELRLYDSAGTTLLKTQQVPIVTGTNQGIMESILNGLADATYTIKVRALGSSGYGAESNSHQITLTTPAPALLPSAPTTLTLIAPANTHYQFQWDGLDTGSNTTTGIGALLMLYDQPGTTLITTRTVSLVVGNNQALVSGILSGQPSATYELRARSRNDTGYSADSNGIAVIVP